jgi:Family of unknown function (DUF6220)
MRRAFAVLATVQVLAVVVQFFLAASGAFDTAPNEESFQPHRMLGAGLFLIAMVVTVVAAIARVPGRLIGLSGLVAGLVLVQFVIAGIAGAFDDAGTTTTAGVLIFGLHGFNGLAVMSVSGTVVRRAWVLARPATRALAAP